MLALGTEDLKAKCFDHGCVALMLGFFRGFPFSSGHLSFLLYFAEFPFLPVTGHSILIVM